MAVRLQMNVGLVAEDRRLPDSADTAIVVEPVIGSTTRTKGSLFLLVTAAGGRKLREATRVVAERIRDDYYYDLSAGISVCLRKAIRGANSVLLHSPDRPVVAPGDSPPIGLALAVVRGNELYVTTAGPAEAYLIRQSRLLTLPDSTPDSGLPHEDTEGPEVWHGEIATGDCLVLVSPNVTHRIGLGPLQETVGQLHPQAAVEEIQRQFGSGSLGSVGGDGIVIAEATEVASTHRSAPLKPVWPSESLAGSPEHSPIPLADAVSGGMVAVQTQARQVGVVADGWLRRSVYGLFDRMPARPISRGRVTPLTVRRERQQRAAVAILGILAVIAIVGSALWFFGGASQSQSIDQQHVAQAAYAQALADINQVYGHGRDLMSHDRKTADKLLEDAYKKLLVARTNGYSEAQIAGPMSQIEIGLDQFYGVTILNPQVVASFGSDELTSLVLGPDGEGYVLDSSLSAVYWVNLDTGSKFAVVKVGQEPTAGEGVVTRPQLMTTGANDVVILDDVNSLWRWRPAKGDTTGRGTLVQIYIPDQQAWGHGSRAIGTYVVNAVVGQYNFYIVVPSMDQVMKYQPATDGSGFPFEGKAKYLAVNQDVSKVDDMYVDGRLYLVDKGVITQYDLGQAVKGWKPDLPLDTILRPHAPVYTRISADNPLKDQGTFYAYDVYNRRVLALKKADASISGIYMAASTQPWLTSVQGLFVKPSADGKTTYLYWIESGNLMKADLNPPQPSANASPSASAGASAGASGSAGTGASASGQ